MSYKLLGVKKIGRSIRIRPQSDGARRTAVSAERRKNGELCFSSFFPFFLLSFSVTASLREFKHCYRSQHQDSTWLGLYSRNIDLCSIEFVPIDRRTKMTRGSHFEGLISERSLVPELLETSRQR